MKLRLRAEKKKQNSSRSIHFKSLSTSNELQQLYAIEAKNRYSSLMSNSHGELDDQNKYDLLSDACSDIGKKLLPIKPKRKWSNLNKTDNVTKARKTLIFALESGSKTDINNATSDLACAHRGSQDIYIYIYIYIYFHSN